MPDGDLLPGHGAGWLDRADIDDPPVDPAMRTNLDQANACVATSRGRVRSRTRTVALVTVVAGTLTGALAGVGVAVVSSTSEPATTIANTASTTPVATTILRPKACIGLTAQTVTDGAGDTATLAGVIARFEHAYYARRDVEAALALVGPHAGVTREGLTAAVAALPTGTTHCVGVSVIAENTAEVHLVELHPDGRRLDYLQLINVAAAASGLVITNIQKRGS